MQIAQIRGVILEEVVLYLLKKVGYRIVLSTEEGTRPGGAGLEVQGRGEWHQIDALAAFDHTPAFMYPLRLMVEAKCYSAGRPIGIEVARNAVGVLKDIAENYFTLRSRARGADSVKAPRFNYHSAIFSSSGYTKAAQRYAIAHQIFLIQYDHVRLLRPVIDGILGLTPRHFNGAAIARATDRVSHDVRYAIRARLLLEDAPAWAGRPFSPAGGRHLATGIIHPLREVGGSYFGMLQGKWPMHLLSRHPLPPEVFANTDVVTCKVYGRESTSWSFSPVHLRQEDPAWFRLEFDIPEEVAALVASVRADAEALADVKREHFSFLHVAGYIGGVYRHVRLELDEPWLGAYLARIRR